MTLLLRTNPNAEIGTVIFVVEGAKDEFQILQYIFCRIFDYRITVRTPKVGTVKFVELTSRRRSLNRIIILNAESSNMRSLESVEDYLDETYAELALEYNVSIKNSPIFYLWDRDRSNNPSTIALSLTQRLTSPYNNPVTYDHGLLLMSFPAIEAFITTCFEDNDKWNGTEHIKDYAHRKKYAINKVDAQLLCIATERMFAAIRDMLDLEVNVNIIEILPDEMQNILSKEEDFFRKNGHYRLLSTFTFSLMWLGIVELFEGT